jgi:hypothetical protein
MSLDVRPCRGLCCWRPDRRAADPPRFRCRGCGSQWDRTEAWTPRDADGRVSVTVRAEAARR